MAVNFKTIFSAFLSFIIIHLLRLLATSQTVKLQYINTENLQST